MAEYNRVNVDLSDLKLNKLKSAAKYQAGVTLRMNMRIFNGKDLPHELLLTARPKAKLISAFENNISTGIKLSKTQIVKIVQSGWKICRFIIM